MPERWEIVQSVTEEENLGARVYPKSMKKLMEETWSPLSLPGPTPGLV